MTSKVNNGFMTLNELCEYHGIKLIPRYLHDENRGIIGDNPEFFKKNGEDCADDIIDDLDDLLSDDESDESGLAPATPLPDDAAFEPKKPKTDTVSALLESESMDETESDGFRGCAESSSLASLNPEMATLAEEECARNAIINAEINAIVGEITLLSLPADALLQLHKSHFSGDFVYDDAKRTLNRNIALALTYQDVPPLERNVPKFLPEACKENESYSAYMVDIQAFDLLWVWHNHKDHQTDPEALNGLFADIFTGDQFDFEKARAIAIGQYEKKSNKTTGYLTAKQKIKFLRLPECWQEDLAVLRSDAIRQRQDEAKKKARREQEKLDALGVRAIDIRHKLDKHAKINPIDTKDIDMDECINIWIALQHSGGKTNNLSGIIAAYKKLSGSSVDKSKLRRRIKLFERALIL